VCIRNFGKVGVFGGCIDLVMITGVCEDGDVRLVDGYSAYEGRVELCRSGVWTQICGNGWHTAHTAVVCTQLGFSPNSKQTLLDT